jgi:hypothetical protein
MILLILNHGANINCIDDQNNTPLHSVIKQIPLTDNELTSTDTFKLRFQDVIHPEILNRWPHTTRFNF